MNYWTPPGATGWSGGARPCWCGPTPRWCGKAPPQEPPVGQGGRRLPPLEQGGAASGNTAAPCPNAGRSTAAKGRTRLTLIVSPTGFKHTGVFPEQGGQPGAWYGRKIRAAGRPIRVLNLFGYTGGATLACAAAGGLGVPCGRLQGGWCSGARRTPPPAAWPAGPSAGWWMTAPSSWPGKSAGAVPTTPSSWDPPSLWPGARGRGVEAGGLRLRPDLPVRRPGWAASRCSLPSTATPQG